MGDRGFERPIDQLCRARHGDPGRTNGQQDNEEVPEGFRQDAPAGGADTSRAVNAQRVPYARQGLGRISLAGKCVCWWTGGTTRLSLRLLARQTFLPVLLSLAGAATAAGDPGFRPLLLDGQTSLEVESTPGLDLGPQSTIEFVVATAWEDEDGVTAYPAVLGRREPYDGDEPAGFAAATQYSVHVAPDRRSLGLFDGTRYASVPFDFTDGRLHHVALVTREVRTSVYVDRELRGVLDVGLGATPGLPLHVGSSDGGSELFMGAIPSVRLWRRELTAEEVTAIADLLGPPGEGDPDASGLAAFSHLTRA